MDRRSLVGYSLRVPKVLVCLVTHSCPALVNPVDCSLPGSSARGILQARILQWVAIPFSKGSYPLSLLHCGQIIYSLSHQGSLGHSPWGGKRVGHNLATE